MSNLTEKDLNCIARHIQEYVKKEMHGERNFPCACTNCGLCTGEVIGYQWEAFSKLSEITGVKISARKGFKV